MELSRPKLWKFFYQLKKSFSTLNKTRLGQTGCLSNLYYLLATQAPSFLIHPLSQTRSARPWLVGSPHCTAYVSLRRHHSTPFVTMCFPQQSQLGHTWQPLLTVQPMCHLEGTIPLHLLPSASHPTLT